MNTIELSKVYVYISCIYFYSKHFLLYVDGVLLCLNISNVAVITEKAYDQMFCEPIIYLENINV